MDFPPSPPFVLLDNSKNYSGKNPGLLFTKPHDVIICKSLSRVNSTLTKIENALAQGHYLAGWISYEAGLSFHPTLKNKALTLAPEPLIWMGVFKRPRSFSVQELTDFFQRVKVTTPAAGLTKPPKSLESKKAFNAEFRKILNYIKTGDIYQVNHTFPLELEVFGPALKFYSQLRDAQPVPFGSFIDTGEWKVLSFSPELFFSRKGDQLISRPMKGTAKPGLTLEQTLEKMKLLSGDEKNRAENLMITDLIRNDFSRICLPGTVKVPKLFEVERFRTVLQMSSEVRGKLKKRVSFSDILTALFPCGSITGAPKIRAMEIISETEPNPRGIYTGALGYISPKSDMTFSIPIRTAVINKEGKGKFGIGSGLVAQSKPADEFAECKLKGKFLETNPKDFALIETMLWTKDKGITFLEDHLARLKDSADFFDFPCNILGIRDKLTLLSKTLADRGPQKIRLTLDNKGDPVFETRPYPEPQNQTTLKVILSGKKVDSKDVFLFHKTTRRDLYRSEFGRARQKGYYDIIFCNEEGDITEGTFNNIFLQGNRGGLFTPCLESGLLPGIFRKNLLNKGRVTESSLTCEDLETASKIFLGNSVSGLVEVTVISGK